MHPANFQILPYSPAYQQGVDQLLTAIQEEYEHAILSDPSRKLDTLSLNKNEWYWVALVDGQVVGTAGLLDLHNDKVVLKWMMLAKEYRGKDKGIAVALLNTVIRAARQQNNDEIYLGTMEQFKSAQKFYTKSGFKQISREELPADFEASPLDSLFYKRKL